MKNVLIAAIAGVTIMATTAIVKAEEAVYGFDALSYNGELNYNLTDEDWTGDIGAKYRVAQDVQLTGSVYYSDLNNGVLRVDNYRVGVEFDFSDAVKLHGYAQLDDNMNHADTVVGASFNF